MDVDAALQSQIRNIETAYGKSLDHWFAIIDASGLTKHNEVVAMLKSDHGLAHGAAHTPLAARPATQPRRRSRIVGPGRHSSSRTARLAS